MIVDQLMPIGQLGVLLLFVAALVGSPGPANMMLMASGLTFGARPAVPFLLGTMSGFQVIYWLNVLGLYAVLTAAPTVFAVLKYACIGYILYLAWVIIRSPIADPDSSTPLPGFPRGVIVHPLNPKAYAMQVAAIAQFVSPERYWVDAVVVSLVFWMLGGLLNGGWLLAGSWLREASGNTRALEILKIALAVLMVGSTIISLQAVTT